MSEDQAGPPVASLIENSSLGAAGARRLRARTPPDARLAMRKITRQMAAERAVEEADAAEQVRRSGRRSPGGSSPVAHTADEVTYLTVAQTASLMQVSKMTVYRLVHDGRLRAARVGRSFQIAKPSVLDYLAQADQSSSAG